MKKRVLALFLCFTMIFSLIPGQALAQEAGDSTEGTRATEPEVTEPEETEPEVTEPEETEPEATEPEVTEPENLPSAQSDLPGGSCGDSATWTFDESTGLLTISGSGAMYDYEFSPDVAPWPGYSVKKVVIEPGITRIGNYAFVNRYNMTDVSIPDTVTSIGIQAFSGCDKLTVVLLPDGLTSIGMQAFLNCKNLVRITIPEGVTSISEKAFSGCRSMQVATLLGNVTSIGNSAFSNCSALTAINIPNSVTTIGAGSFSSCASLASINLSNSVTSIGDSAFHSCTALKEIILPDSVSSLGYTAFASCTALESVSLPASLTSLNSNTFQSCTNLLRVYIPKSITVINSRFSNSNALAEIFYGGSIEDWAKVDQGTLPSNAAVFYNCTGLGDPDIPRGKCGSTCAWSFDPYTGKLTIEGTYSTYTFTQDSDSSGKEVPWKDYLGQILSVEVQGVSGISAYAFADAVNLASITMDSVTYIGDCAFRDCVSLKSVSLSDSLNNLRSYAFAGSGITQFSVPENVRSLSGTFQDCSALQAVYIPTNTRSIESSTFQNCPSLTDIYYAGYESDWTGAFSGTLSDQVTVHYRSTALDMPGTPGILTGECGYHATWTFDEATGLLTISGSGEIFDFGHLTDSQGIETGEIRDVPWKSFLTEIKTVRIGDGITSIGNEAFKNAVNLTAVYAPTVTSVGKRAFYKAASLKTADIPGLRWIDAYAFSGCKALTSLPLPDNFSWFKDYAFQECGFTEYTLPGKVTGMPFLFEGCADLKAVFIPASVKTIGNTTFRNCTSLTDIYYEGSQEDWAAIYYPIKGPDEYNNATIHYNCTGLGEPDAEILSGQCGDAAYWELNLSTGVLSITGSGKIDDFDFSPPWEDYADQILEVYITDGITNLPIASFTYCTQMRKITVPASLIWFDTSVFTNNPITTAGPIGSGCDYEFGWTEHIPAFAFECLPITTIHVPITLKSVSSSAFNGCSSLTDVYYPGTPSQWAAIYINEWHNGYFLNADVHYGSFDAEVRYYSEYDPDGMAACFGGGLPNCFVTDETDAAFTADPTAFVGQYVLVEYTRDDDGIDTLVSMTALETAIATITTISSGGITIGEKVYPMDGGIEALEVYLGETVLYHTLNDELVGIEILQESQGYLCSWIQSKGLLIICPDKAMLQDETFPLSNYADQDTITFLSGISSMPGIAVNYRTDKLGYVLHLELGGYSAINNGWCFPNSHLGFSYDSQYFIPPERFEEVFGPSYVATANAAANTDNSVFLSMYMRSSDPSANPWGGNCHGMSLLSMLFYSNRLPWTSYSSSFSTVNLYHNQLSPEIDASYSLLFASAGASSTLTAMIERYQILFKNINYGYSMENSTRTYLYEYETGGNYSEHIAGGQYIQRLLDTIWDAEEPLLATMQATGAAHAVVIRTDKPPVSMGNGWYRVYIYDPNTPYIAQQYIDQTGLNPLGGYLNRHSDDRYIELNPTLNVWRYNFSATSVEYWGSDASGNVLYRGKSFHKKIHPHQLWVCPLSDNVPLSFDGTEEWTPRWEQETTIIYVFGNSNFRVLSAQDILLCEFENGVPTSLAEGVTYMTCAGITADGTGNLGGTLSLPGYDFQIEFGGGGDISVIGPEFAYNMASDHPANISVAMSEGAVTVDNTDGGEILMQLTHIYSNSEYTSVVADGTLEAGDSVTLTLDENTFKGSLTGSGSLELLTDNHNAPDSRPLHNLTEGSGTVEIQDVTANLETVRVELDEILFAGLEAVYADGQPCKVIHSETGLYADVPEGTGLLVTYSWHIGDETDVHSQYPTGMKVYRIVVGENGYIAEYIPELDDLLQYSGSSIRITGNKGIRMITSITKGNKSALTGEGLAGFTLEEYGTALCWATDLAPGEDLVLGKDYTRSNYAYKKGVADPIFAQTDSLIQYTNVLVGFDDDQCIPDIAMRPYIILSDAEGNQVTLYGGTVYRSIGYIAWQNRTVFKPGSASYDFVWGIIHHVYGDIYDADYQQ